MRYDVLKNGKTAGVQTVKVFKAGKGYRIRIEINPKIELPEVDFGNDGILFKQCGLHSPAMTKVCFPKLAGYLFAVLNNSTKKSVEFLAYPVRKEEEIKVQGTLHI